MRAIRLLLVDDETRFVETLGKRLASRGYDVEGVTSGHAALERLAQREFDVVLLDVRMPGIDGLETLREIRRRHALVQVVLLSGNASIDAAVRGMRLGAVDYVLKPAALEEVQAKVEEAFEKGQLEAENPRRGREG